MEGQERKSQLMKELDTYTRRRRLSVTLYAVGALFICCGVWIGYLGVAGWLYTSEVFSTRVPVVQPKYGDPMFWFLSKEETAQHPLVVLGIALILTALGVSAAFLGFRLDPDRYKK